MKHLLWILGSLASVALASQACSSEQTTVDDTDGGSSSGGTSSGGSSSGGGDSGGSSSGGSSSGGSSSGGTSSGGSSSGGGDGGERCQEAADRIIAKLEACGIAGADGGTDPDPEAECTATIAEEAEKYADCYEAADCGALTGDDADAGAALAGCLSAD